MVGTIHKKKNYKSSKNIAQVSKSSISLPKSELASAAKVSGIVSLFLGWIPFLGWALIFFSVIAGFFAIRDIDEGKYNESSRRTARAGIILGVISLILIPIELIIFGLLMYFGLFAI